MNQQIKQRWIEALKSGEYQQGYEALRYNNKFCCLGVLTDLYIKEHGLQWHKAATDLNDGTNASFEEIAGYIEQDPKL